MTRFKTSRIDKENKPPIRRTKSKTICKNKVQKVWDDAKISDKDSSQIKDKKGTKPMCSYHKCKKKSVGSYTVDLDIKGLFFCKEHEKDIYSAILWTVLGVEELAQKSMGVFKK